jgi:hypothetical protein
MNPEEQEAGLTLWANGVAEEFDGMERPELAAVFRALARRDTEAAREALGVFSPAMLEAVREMVQLEQADRAAADEERFVEILAWLLALVDEVEEGQRLFGFEPDEDGPIQ